MKRLRVILWIAVVVLAVPAALLARRREEEGLPAYGAVPSFTMADTAGATISEADLRGKVLIVDFIFTRCIESCPTLTARMKNIARELAEVPDVRFVSISVDPETDTPARLREYAARFEADPARWMFLTGTRNVDVERVAAQGFRLAVDRRAADIIHANRFVLVDRTLTIRGYYDALVPEEMTTLVRDAKRLAR